MARSTYVYVVHDRAGLVCAYTVKRELVSFLVKYRTNYTGLRAWRLRDGFQPQPPVELNIKDLIEEHTA